MIKKDNNYKNINCNDVRVLIDKALLSGNLADIKEETKFHIQKCRSCSEYLNKSENLMNLISNVEVVGPNKVFSDKLSSRVLSKVRSKNTPAYKEIGRSFTKKEPVLLWLRWAVPLASIALILALTIIRTPWFTSERQERFALEKYVAEKPDSGFWKLEGFSEIKLGENNTKISEKNVVEMKIKPLESIARANEIEPDPLLTVNIALLEPGIANSVMSQMANKMINEGYDINSIASYEASDEDSYTALTNNITNEEDLTNMEEILIKGLSYDSGGYKVIRVLEKEEANDTTENI